MRYEEFRASWVRALRGSGLGIMGSPTESIDTSAMDRCYTVRVEPLGQRAEPFFVTARLSWRWSALQAARTATTEEDMLTEILGRDDAYDLPTEAPWLRIDLSLQASPPWGEPVAMPSRTRLARWLREVTGRFEREPLVTDAVSESEYLEVPAWQGAPRFNCAATGSGDVELHGVALDAWQGLMLPRSWDDPDKADPHPGEQVRQLLDRLSVALSSWMESLDQLRGER